MPRRPPTSETADFLAAATGDAAEREALVPGCKAFNKVVGRAQERAARVGRLLRDAELYETDPAARAMFPAAHQCLAAVNRLTVSLTSDLRDLVLAHRQLDQVAAEIARALADDLPAPPGGGSGSP